MRTKTMVGRAVTAAVGLLMLSSAASAHGAVITGGGTFAANAWPSRLVLAAAGGLPLNCSVTTAGASVSNGIYGTFPAAVGTVIPRISSCYGPAGVPFGVRCNETGTPVPDPPSTSPAAMTLTGNPVGGTTPGSIMGLSCVVRFSPSCYAFVTGSVPTSYANPAGGTHGKLTVLVAGQSLTVFGSTCPIIPNGSATFGAPAPGPLSLSNLEYTLTTAGWTIS